MNRTGIAARTVLACLALRALIPLGYMPGDALSGEFVVLCPTGLPASVARALHIGHDDHASNVVDVDRDCPIGSALNFASLPVDIVEQAVAYALQGIRVAYAGFAYLSLVERRYDSRAPPR